MCIASYALLKIAEAKYALEEWSEFVENSSIPRSVAGQALWNSVSTAMAHVDDVEEAMLIAYSELKQMSNETCESSART